MTNRVTFFFVPAALLSALPVVSLLPSCSSAPCDTGSLLAEPAFVLPLDDTVEDGECTVYGVAINASGEEQRMYCLPGSESRCDCYGGALPSDYQIVMYSQETGEVIDWARLTVLAVPAPTCRTPEVTQGFSAGLRHTIFGVGGGGGAGGAGGAGGDSAIGGGAND